MEMDDDSGSDNVGNDAVDEAGHTACSILHKTGITKVAQFLAFNLMDSTISIGRNLE